MNNQPKKSGVKKFFSVLFTVILIIALCAGGLYAYNIYVSVQDNTFETGTLKINLNDGNALLYEHEYTFEPGMTVVKDFFIKNEGTIDAYYKLYFANIGGELADVLEVKIKDGESTLYEGVLSTLTKENNSTVQAILKTGETHHLTAIFHFPENSGNAAQSKTVQFDFCADAVQAKNNPNRLFD